MQTSAPTAREAVTIRAQAGCLNTDNLAYIRQRPKTVGLGLAW